MDFEWDEDKASANLRWHGVTFRFAARVFQDSAQYEWIDDREDYGEQRCNVIGLVDGLEIVVTYTMRGESVRIISARRANLHERKVYWGS